jgi:hypothetical protein
MTSKIIAMSDEEECSILVMKYGEMTWKLNLKNTMSFENAQEIVEAFLVRPILACCLFNLKFVVDLRGMTDDTPVKECVFAYYDNIREEYVEKIILCDVQIRLNYSGEVDTTTPARAFTKILSKEDLQRIVCKLPHN